MLVKLFVGNLALSVGDAELEEIFRALGEVVSVGCDRQPLTRADRVGSVSLRLNLMT